MQFVYLGLLYNLGFYNHQIQAMSSMTIAGPAMTTIAEITKPTKLNNIPAKPIKPSRFNRLKDIKAIPCAGMKLVNGKGIAIDRAHIKEMMEKIFSPIKLLKMGKRGFVKFSTFRNIGAVFSIIIAKVLRLIDFFPSHFGNHGESKPINNWSENTNKGIESIVV